MKKNNNEFDSVCVCVFVCVCVCVLNKRLCCMPMRKFVRYSLSAPNSKSGPEVIRGFSCSIQLNMKF